MYKQDEIEKWMKAGKICAQVKEYAMPLIKRDAKLLEVAEKIESKILELGGKPSFPVNIGINEKAAHFTPFHDDTTIFSEDLVKLDFGVALEGFITDNAVTIDLTKNKRYAKIITATEQAFQEASKLAIPNTPVNKIGSKIHEIITKAGFSPIRNLSGHEIKPFIIHAGITIPNYDNGNTQRLKDGMIISIEPFATTGVGEVIDGKTSGDFRLVEKKPTRDLFTRQVLEFIDKEYSTMPFASRWLVKKFGTKVLFTIKQLEQSGVLHNYKELVEKSKAPVSQHENTILVAEKPTVLT